MNRALAVLTGGAFLTLVVGVVGSGHPVPVLLLGAVFTLLGTIGFGWVTRRGRLGWSVAYVVVQLVLAVAVFATVPSVLGLTRLPTTAPRPCRAAPSYSCSARSTR